MAAQVDLADLKNLQTIVLDLEELRKLQSIAKRPGVLSILSREISYHEAKIFSNSTVSDEKGPEEDTGEVKLAEMGKKRKRKAKEEPISSKMKKKKSKLSNVEKPLVVNESSCRSMEEESDQQSLQARTSEQVLWDKPSSSDVTGTSPREVFATENVDFSTKTNQTMSSLVFAAASESRFGSTQKMTCCHDYQRCHEAEHPCHKPFCFKYCETEHFMANCPKVPQYAVNPSGMKTVTAGSSYKNMHQEPIPQFVQSKSSEHGVLERASSSGINKAYPMAVVATENAGVSNKSSVTMPKYIVPIETSSDTVGVTHKVVKLPSPLAVATYDSRFSLSHQRCRTCEGPHADSECFRRKIVCFNCRQVGHIAAKCPSATASAFRWNVWKLTQPGQKMS